MDDEKGSTRPDDDSLLREIAAAPAVPIPQDFATFVLLEPGTVVDGAFQIEARLGAGGMGVVYAAHDLKLDREVALKLMRLDRGPNQLGTKLPEVFEREARATARLNHPNIVTLHQFGNWNGLLYLVLERLRGETLQTRMERSPITLAEGITILEHVARALVHTHAAGITHRDLKPQNVFLLADGGVKVLDFGVSGLGRMPESVPAPVAPGVIRSTLSLAGTPGYMAPEQWDGTAQDARTDLFAMGVMLYQLATGELPFGTKPVDLSARAPALDGKVPLEASALVPLVAWCLAPRRDDRLASAQELADQLRAIRDGLGGSSGGGSVSTGGGALATARTYSKSRRRRLAAIIALAMVGSAMGIAVLRNRFQSDSCNADRIARVWNEPARARFATQFGDTPAWREISRALDSYAGQWTPLREGACRSGTQLAQKCLDGRLAAFERLVNKLDGMKPDVALSSSRGLPALADCADREYLARTAQPEKPTPRDPKALVPVALTLSGPGGEIVHSATFVDGDLAVAGHMSPDAALAGTRLPDPVTTEGSYGFIARITLDGVIRWVQINEKAPTNLIATSGDAVIVSGWVHKDGRLAGEPLAEQPHVHDGFIMSLDAKTGKRRWVRTVAAKPVSGIRGMTTDRDGNIYAVGEFTGSATFGRDVAVSAGTATEAAPFIASWNKDGNVRWVQAGRDTTQAKSWGIAADGESVVFGSFVRGAGTLGGLPFGTKSCVIGRLASDTGEVKWLHHESGVLMRCMVDAVAIQGKRIAASGRRYFENGGWVAELDYADGSIKWAAPLGGSEHDVPKALAFASDGTLYVGGHFTTATVQIGSQTLASNGQWEAYVGTFDAKGQNLHALSFGGATADRVRWLALGPNGELFAGGRFENLMRIGDRVLHGVGGNDGFIVEISDALLKTPPPPAASASP